MLASKVWPMAQYWAVPISLFVFASFLWTYYMKSKRGHRRLPTGPTGLPVVGCLPMVRHRTEVVFQKWAKRYGDIYSLYLGPKLVVVLNSYEYIKEAMVTYSDSFDARPTGYFTEIIAKGHGLIWGNGQPWKEQRKFSIRVFRHLKFNNNSMENMLLMEAQYLGMAVEGITDKAFDPHMLLNFAVGNILCQVLFGTRFDYDDTKFGDILQRLSGWVTKYNFVNNILNFYPWLTLIPGNMFNTNESVKNMEHILQFIKEHVHDHRYTYIPGTPRDFLDAYLEELDSQKEKGLEASSFTEFQLVMVLRDLFAGGIETIESVTLWGVLYMVLYPEIQSKVQDELDAMVSQGRGITLEDKEMLPYTRATLHEILRLSNTDPLCVPRKTSKDVIFKGYFIPRGTDVYLNFWSVHFDERYYKNPQKFDPKRYLDKDGRVIRMKPPLHFGLGARDCIGKGLAEKTLFIFFANLLKDFKLQLPKGEQRPSVKDGTFGVVYVPPKFMIRASRRN